jgi:hypothetical protein
MSPKTLRGTIRTSLVLLLLGVTIAETGCKSIAKSRSLPQDFVYRESVYRSLLNLASARTASEQEMAAEELVIVIRNKRPKGYRGISAHVLPHGQDLTPVKWESLEELKRVAYVSVFDPVHGTQPAYDGFIVQMLTPKTAEILRTLDLLGPYNPPPR